MIEFENVGFAADAFASSDIVTIACDGVEAFSTCELDGPVLVDSDAMLSFDDKDSLVNNANLSGSVNPAIENDEASSSDRTLLGTLGTLVLVVINERASAIGSVEPVTAKFED